MQNVYQVTLTLFSGVNEKLGYQLFKDHVDWAHGGDIHQ